MVTSAGTTTLAYDYEGRISTITYPSSATNSFTYNGLDTRVGKVDSAGTTTYRRDGDDVLSPVLEAGGTKFTPGISRRTGTSSYFYHQDRMGSAIRQTTATQGSLTSRQYDAFGNVAYVGGTWVGPFGFVGGEGYQEDSDSGLQLLGHRYYDPSTGRFLTRDPIQDGRNWYGYCDNNPLQWVDDEGEGKKQVGTGKRQGPNRSIDHPSRGRAEEGARRDGDGKPIHHPNPGGNGGHFHPSDKDGNKIPGPHHRYYFEPIQMPDITPALEGIAVVVVVVGFIWLTGGAGAVVLAL